MTHSTVTVTGADVASAVPQPAHISIHIYQESALVQLLKAGDSLKQFLSHPRHTGSSQAAINHEQLALGVTQILLGLVSWALGVCLSLGPGTELRAFGCAFWAGSVAITAGAGAIVHEKHRGKLSGHVSGLLTLAGIVTAVAAVVLGVRSLIWQKDGLNYTEIISSCKRPEHVITAPAYQTMWERSYNSDWREKECRASMEIMVNLFIGFCILLTVVCILKVIVALASLGLGLRSMCGPSPWPLDGEESEKKLLRENPVSLSPSLEETPTDITL